MTQSNPQLFKQSGADFYKECIQQMPGLIVVMDQDSKFICSNSYTSKLFGYKNEDEMLGIDAHGMRCPAVQSASEFIKQDQYVMQNKTELTILDIHSYADKHEKILLTKKKPLMIQNEVKGTICHCTEIYSTSLNYIVAEIIKSDKQYYNKQENGTRSYAIDTLLNETKLSKRESTCVYYVVRGFTMKEIAKKLGLSWRTIETYLQNVKLKWGCERKHEIIDFAIANGFLNFVPKSVLANNLSHIIHDDTEH